MTPSPIGRQEKTSNESQQPTKVLYPSLVATIPSNQSENPTYIRGVIDSRIAAHKNHGFFEWAYSGKANTSMLLAIDYIISTFDHKKTSATNSPLPSTISFNEAIKNYRHFFRPGECSFTFPPDMSPSYSSPSPFYDSIARECFLYVDWKLINTPVPILCFNCKYNNNKCVNVHLEHTRTNYSKNKTLFPLWTASGAVNWCIIMNYKCPSCNSSYAANDGTLF